MKHLYMTDLRGGMINEAPKNEKQEGDNWF